MLALDNKSKIYTFENQIFVRRVKNVRSRRERSDVAPRTFPREYWPAERAVSLPATRDYRPRYRQLEKENCDAMQRKLGATG